MELSRAGVQYGRIAVIGGRYDIADLNENRKIERARHYGYVRRFTPILDHEAAQFFWIVVEKLGGTHVARNEDRIVRQPAQGSAAIVSLKNAQQSVREIVEVVRA